MPFKLHSKFTCFINLNKMHMPSSLWMGFQLMWMASFSFVLKASDLLQILWWISFNNSCSDICKLSRTDEFWGWRKMGVCCITCFLISDSHYVLNLAINTLLCLCNHMNASAADRLITTVFFWQIQYLMIFVWVGFKM